MNYQLTGHRPRDDRLTSTLSHQPSYFSHQTSAISPLTSALSPQTSAIRPQPSALRLQPSALRLQPSDLSHQPSDFQTCHSEVIGTKKQQLQLHMRLQLLLLISHLYVLYNVKNGRLTKEKVLIAWFFAKKHLPLHSLYS